jgi:hypothetical protein
MKTRLATTIDAERMTDPLSSVAVPGPHARMNAKRRADAVLLCTERSLFGSDTG